MKGRAPASGFVPLISGDLFAVVINFKRLVPFSFFCKIAIALFNDAPCPSLFSLKISDDGAKILDQTGGTL